ncbi:MAG: ribose-5-phosphate isomerase RpiA [Asgard group archaeon]|nr:ribose-5-phosphate isomerase RpiA [Asgard group archaeon]
MTKNKIALKRKAAEKALDFVQDGMILGIGSGSTIKEFIDALKQSAIDSSSLINIPSSYDTEQMLIKNGLHVGTLNQYPQIDLVIDGADRVDSELNLIKGGGAALLREKINIAAAKEVIIIIDQTKKVKNFDDSFPIPVEVFPLAIQYVEKKLKSLSGKPQLRKASNKLGPTITDNGNIIWDTTFNTIKNPRELEKILNNIPGVMENGLFPNYLITKVINGKQSGVEILEKKND